MKLKVIILTQENCIYCDDAKAILDRLSSEYPLSVSAIDLGTPEGQELAERNGVLFPPGILLDGKFFSYGRLSERKLRKEIEKRLTLR